MPGHKRETRGCALRSVSLHFRVLLRCSHAILNWTQLSYADVVLGRNSSVNAMITVLVLLYLMLVNTTLTIFKSVCVCVCVCDVVCVFGACGSG